MQRHDVFNPSVVNITTGTTVRWTNTDDETHTTTSDNGVWNSGGLNSGQSFSFTFNAPGTYPYRCLIHPDEMRGTVNVSGPAITPTAGTPSATATPATGTTDVNIQGFAFQPNNVTVQVGTTVRWTNQDSSTHTTTSDTGAWDSGNLGQGSQFSYTFNTAGTYPYHCAIHPGMTGTVNVVVPGTPGTPQPTTTSQATLTAGTTGTAQVTGTAQASATTQPGITNASIVDYAFQPGTLNVQVGSTVRWTNNGQAPHTIASNMAGAFNSGRLDSGQSYSFTFNAPGSYSYHCDFHNNMTGVINVAQGSGTPSAQPSSTPTRRATSTPVIVPTPGTFAVTIQNYAYSPATITVKTGDTVRWTNLDNDRHSVTSTTGAFNSGEFTLNGTYSFTFNTPGTYEYICTVHGAFMTGHVVVQSVGGRFTDVAPGSTFYSFINCLVDNNVLSGYSDGTFRPGNEVTRGQLSKIIANSAGYNEPVTAQTFKDVEPGSTFYLYIERIASRGIIGGYACGGPGEPCTAGNRPYFRPGANATRGQISKIVANAANLSTMPTSQTFADVATNSTFYLWIERLAANNSMSGYTCGGTDEPCDTSRRAYFRPATNTTRGQISKIVSTTFFPQCNP